MNRAYYYIGTMLNEGNDKKTEVAEKKRWQLATIKKSLNEESGLSPIVDVLMKRDGMTRLRAEAKVKKAKEKLHKKLAKANVDMDLYDTFMQDEFGLEPDYIDELL